MNNGRFRWQTCTVAHQHDECVALKITGLEVRTGLHRHYGRRAYNLNTYSLLSHAVNLFHGLLQQALQCHGQPVFEDRWMTRKASRHTRIAQHDRGFQCLKSRLVQKKTTRLHMIPNSQVLINASFFQKRLGQFDQTIHGCRASPIKHKRTKASNCRHTVHRPPTDHLAFFSCPYYLQRANVTAPVDGVILEATQ